MTCLSPTDFDLFINITGLAYKITGKLVLVHSEHPAIWQFFDGLFCYSKGVGV